MDIDNEYQEEEMVDFEDIERSDMIPIIVPDNDQATLHEMPLKRLPSSMPLLPLRDAMFFPGVTFPVLVARPRSVAVVEYLEHAEHPYIIVAAQKDPSVESPEQDDLFPIGMVAEVMRVMDMNDNNIFTIFLRGVRRVKIEFVGTDFEYPYLMGIQTTLKDKKPREDMEYEVLAEYLRDTVVRIMEYLPNFPKPVIQATKKLTHPELIVNFACTHIPDAIEQKIELLMVDDLKQRAYQMQRYANTVLEKVELKHAIHVRTKVDMDKQQKDYYLQQQLKVIKEELQEGSDDEYNSLAERGKQKQWSKEVKATFEKELKKLQATPTQAPEYSIQLQYLETMLDLPWEEHTEDNFNLKNAADTLDHDHYGLEKVKERILEHLAVLKLKGDMRSPIICLYGPPGVGKTSLGKSIATALGRKYVRISLGGLHDEAEIRGHRRTYIGAMPGRIIKGFLKAGAGNPVFVLDEIDKIASSFKGDPASALLEVLDPEQNNTFHDNYLDVDYDLSKALFIATANNIHDIPQPLLDRMELIEVSGYIQEEKVEIAARHLLPKELENHGLLKSQVKIGKRTINSLIDSYTRESGVRQLEKRIAALLRKVARKIAEQEETNEPSNLLPITITPADLHSYLGPTPFTREVYEGNSHAGVVTGLAWTSVGGEILTIESAISPSRSGKMSITGNLGDVMKESAILALEYIKSNATYYGISSSIFDHWNVHIHVPEGAIPKDGPSAGITLVTSLISTFTQRKVRANVAMTGEITLRGRVLPVGGIREKILAAKRAGIKSIVLCEENRKDVEEIKEDYLRGLDFIYVREITEVIDAVLTNTKVESPIDLMKLVEEREQKQYLQASTLQHPHPSANATTH